MYHKIGYQVIYLFFIVCQSMSQGADTNQIHLPSASKDSNQNIIPLQQYLMGEPLKYITNAIKLSAIVSFVHKNKTVPFLEIRRDIDWKISKEKVEPKGGQEHHDGELMSGGKNGEELSRGNIWNSECLLCNKQFRNTSYLALHYAMRHSSQLTVVFGSSGIPNNTSKPKQKTLEHLLNQYLFTQIHSEQLNLLFENDLSPQDRFLYCIGLLHQLINLTSISENYVSRREINEVCTIIAFDMLERNLWVVVGWICLVIFIIGTLLMITYLYDVVQNSNSNYNKKKIIHYS